MCQALSWEICMHYFILPSQKKFRGRYIPHFTDVVAEALRITSQDYTMGK